MTVFSFQDKVPQKLSLDLKQDSARIGNLTGHALSRILRPEGRELELIQAVPLAPFLASKGKSPD
jgi:hypothetical protein